MDTFGIYTNRTGHVDVSKTLRGAKMIATRLGYDMVSIRYNCGYTASILEYKKNGKWHKYHDGNSKFKFVKKENIKQP
jgi:hypothetical protein